MNRFVRIGLGIAAAGLLTGTANAHGVNWSVTIGSPGFGVWAPAPIYAPPVVVGAVPYYAPPPVYIAPPPVYYAPGYVVRPAPVWVGRQHRPHRDWHRGGGRYRYR